MSLQVQAPRYDSEEAGSEAAVSSPAIQGAEEKESALGESALSLAWRFHTFMGLAQPGDIAFARDTPEDGSFDART